MWYLKQSNSVAQSRMVVSKNLGKATKGSCYLTGRKLQLCEINSRGFMYNIVPIVNNIMYA